VTKRVPKKWIGTNADEISLLESCWFDPKAANRPSEFIERFVCYTTGDVEKTGEPVTLLPWQHETLDRLFGWKRKNGTRRYTSASVWTKKQSGKTALCSWVLIYLLVANGEASVEVYSVANSSEQADQISRLARVVVEASHQLEVLPSAKRIIFQITSSLTQFCHRKRRSPWE